MKTLNQYGAGCRCLMRLRENEGEPQMSDQVFIESYRDRFPHWENRPGQMDTSMFCDLVKDLKLASRVYVFRDYERVLQEYRAGHSILVVTERAPQQNELNPAPARYVLLVMAMYETAFTLWCPHPSGAAEVLEKVGREYWNRWYSLGMVLQRSPSSAARPPISLFPSRKTGPDPLRENHGRTERVAF